MRSARSGASREATEWRRPLPEAESEPRGRGQVQELDVREEGSLVGKRNALRDTGHAEASLQLAQGGREPVEVLGVAGGADVSVLRHDRGSVQHGAEAADHDVAHLVELESGDDLLGAKAQGSPEVRARSTKARKD